VKNQVKMSIEQLEQLVSFLKNRQEHGNMKPFVLVGMSKHPNGSAFVEFEQPCEYHDCNSSYHRYDAGVTEQRPTDPEKESFVLEIRWQVDDVLEERPDLTKEQAEAVLRYLDRHHDCTIGINWDVIRDVAEQLFPEETE
jgi:hypothetical protein